MTDVTEILSRSRLSLDKPVRDALQEGRTVRSRNRHGEYAIVLSDNPAFRNQLTSIDGLADQRADWTIIVTDFTLANVVKAESDGRPELPFFAPVLYPSGHRAGTIMVNASPFGNTNSDQGRIRTQVVFFSTLRQGDLFRESVADEMGRAVVFQATGDADDDGRVEGKSAAGEVRVFDEGPDSLVFKVLEAA